MDYVQLGEATADMVAELLCDGKTIADLPYRTFDNGTATINTETCAAWAWTWRRSRRPSSPTAPPFEELVTAEEFE